MYSNGDQVQAINFSCRKLHCKKLTANVPFPLNMFDK